MENKTFCQSCAMPLENPEDFGTEKDGGKNADYCRYCYESGAFTGDVSMEGMIEACVPFTLEAGAYKTAARKPAPPCGSTSQSSSAGRRRSGHICRRARRAFRQI